MCANRNLIVFSFLAVLLLQVICTNFSNKLNPPPNIQEILEILEKNKDWVTFDFKIVAKTTFIENSNENDFTFEPINFNSLNILEVNTPPPRFTI